MGILVTGMPAVAATPADPVPVAPGCTMERLPEPGDYRTSLVFEADPTGRYLLGRGYERGGGPEDREPLIWHNGDVSVLPFENGNAQVSGVTSSGTVIAWGTAPEVAQDGVVTELPYDKATTRSMVLSGINERGDISANSWLKSDTGKSEAVPAYYPAGKRNASPVTLPVPDKQESGFTLDIDEDGTMVGWVSTDEGLRAYIWRPDGSHGFLPDPEGTIERTAANEVRGGWAIGGGRIDGEEKTIRWRLDDGTAEVLPGQTRSAVNAQGWTVGTYDYYHAALVISGELFELPGVNQQKPDNEARTINDDGTVIGGAVNPPDSTERHAVRWLCG